MGVQLRRAGSVLASGALVAAAAVVWSAPASADATQSAQWYLSKLGVRQAWTITEGKGIKVGVIDTGVDGQAADLVGAVGAGKDFSGQGSANGQQPVGSTPNHGTNVGSLLAGRGHGPGHSSGVIGTAPAATILTASFVIGGSTDGSPQAIRWAVDNGASVINLSYATNSPGQEDAVRYAESKDVVVVAATGDTASNGQRNRLATPASLPGVVAVTGVDETLKSDPGAVVGTGTALAAPFSTTPSDPNGGAPAKALPVANPHGSASGPYSEQIGTSFSAPIVAGIAALVRAKFPDLDAANVINRLIKTATPEGGAVPNSTYGYGVVNADKAVTATVAPVTANPLGSLVDSSGSSSSPSSPGSSTAPSSPASSGSAPTGSASTAPAQSSGSDSSGLGAGAWVAIAAVVLVAAGLIVWLLSRNRRPPPGAPPSAGYPPPPVSQ
jgi:membrane-anchored mycosin MYCP